MRPDPYLIPRFNLDYNYRDFHYALKSIFFSYDYDIRPLEPIFGKRSIFFTNYGRSSLYILLKALNFPKGSKIGVPLYSCTVVFDAIINAGYVPCFIDVDDNYTLDPEDLKRKIEGLSAVVVIHTLGRPADMDTINKIAGNRPVIEDCAHSLLSEYKGKKTGTLGYASTFSLAKYISAGGGGMIVLNDNNIVEVIKRKIDGLERSSAPKNIKYCFIVFMRSYFYHKPFFGLFALPIGLAIEDKVDLMTKNSFEIESIKKSDLGVFLKKISSFKEKVEIQRSNSFFLIEELKETSLKLPYENKDTYCNYYFFPIRFENKEKRDLAGDLLRKKGVDTAKLFGLTPFKAMQHYGYAGDCPNAEAIADTILVIPNYYTLKKSELLKVVKSVKEVV